MSEEVKKEIPRAIWEGTFTVFGVPLLCSVLDDEAHTRVINVVDIDRLLLVMGSGGHSEPGDWGEFRKWVQGL